jgi:hypothetical protein
MPNDCLNTISAPKLPDFPRSIRPFLTTRFRRLNNNVGYITHWEKFTDFDFQKIIPMPEPIKRTKLKIFSEGTPRGEALREQNFVNFGFKDWYDWSWANWGTKWNSYYGGFVENRPAFRFSTAWDSPIPVIKKLAHLLDTPIHLEYDNDYETIWKFEMHPDGHELCTFEKY